MLAGNVINSLLPIFQKQTCQENRPNDFLRQRDPCGLIVRCLWPIDISHGYMLWVVYFLQLHACFYITMVVFGIEMVLIGTLMHTIAQLEHLRHLVLNICQSSDLMNTEQLIDKVIHVIKYHNKIIE